MPEKSMGVGLVLADFDLNKPCVIIRPRNIPNARLCINVALNGHMVPNRKHPREEILRQIQPLTRRFGQLLDYNLKLRFDQRDLNEEAVLLDKKFSNITFRTIHATQRLRWLAVRQATPIAI